MIFASGRYLLPDRGVTPDTPGENPARRQRDARGPGR